MAKPENELAKELAKPAKYQVYKPSPLEEVTRKQLDFNNATYELGLYLIDEYKAGRCGIEVLDAIIKIFDAQPKAVWRD